MMYDAVIVGGGLIGASAAIAMQQQGMHIALLEAKTMVQPCTTPDLRVLALSHQTLSFLKTLGIQSSLDAKRLCSYDSMYIDDESGRSNFTFNARTVNRYHLGMIVDSYHVQAAMHGMLKSTVDCFFEEKLNAVLRDDEGYLLKTQHRNIKTRVILAADGGQSWLKEYSGITHHEHDYQQRALVAYLQSEKSHEHSAWQRFLSTGSLALLPCPDLHRVSMVWTLPKSEAELLQTLSSVDLNARLQNALGNRLGRLSLCSEVLSFPIRAKHVHHYGAEGVFLMGDAAHTIHPLAGLGANLGFSDVQSLVKILVETPKHLWSDTRVLARYQRERMHVNALVSHLMTALNQSMTEGGVVGKLRGWGMRVFDRLTPLKAMAILYTDTI